MKSYYKSLFINSWNSTFAPHKKEKAKFGAAGQPFDPIRDLLGVPDAPLLSLPTAIYVFSVIGPVTSLAKNLIKLLTEFPLHLLFTALTNALYDYDEDRYLRPTDYSNIFSSIGNGILWILYGISGLLFHYVRSVTSPIESAKYFFKQGNKFGGPTLGWILGGLSVLSTLVSYTALIILAVPALMAIAASAGITTGVSAPGWLLTLGGPLSSALTSLGIVSAGSSLLTAAAGVVTLGASAFALNGIRECFLGGREVQAGKPLRRDNTEWDVSGSDVEAGLGSEEESEHDKWFSFSPHPSSGAGSG